MMKISSPVFEEGAKIPSLYTCDGDNVSPPLKIEDVPQHAKSLALIMDDPDAPSGTFTHWLMWNIDPQTLEIPENEWPEGAEQGINDAGELGYAGPCPPSGEHHYHFKLYALDNFLDIPSEVSKEELEGHVNDHIIEMAEVVGTYKKE